MPDTRRNLAVIVYLDWEGQVNLASPTVTKWIEDGLQDPEGFWERAAQELPWFRTWDRVYEADPPTFRWFVGAQNTFPDF